MADTISPTPNEVLQSLLSAHGYQATINGDFVQVAGHQAQMSAEVYAGSSVNPYQLQLDVLVHLPDGRTVTESFAGIGRSVEYAMGDGFDGFIRSSFHVLLQAFFHDSQREDMAEAWQMPRGNFKAWVGDATFRGQPPVEGEELVSWFGVFADAIQKTPLAPNMYHWIRLYYAQNQGEVMPCEVLLDNHPWEAMQQYMARFSWPRGESFYSTRLFLVLQPV